MRKKNNLEEKKVILFKINQLKRISCFQALECSTKTKC